MNKYYSYPNMDLWKTEMWVDKVAPLAYLIEHIQENNIVKESDYVPSYEFEEGKLNEHPLYRAKTHGIDDPAILAELDKKGLNYLCTGQGGGGFKERCWICICPKEAIENWTKLPVLMVMECEDEDDPRWTMRALTRYMDRVEQVAEKRDHIFVILVNQYPTYDKIYFNIMQEFAILFPCDISNMYIDVSRVLEKGKLRDIPNFNYLGMDGNRADPDECVEYFGELKVPVLNIKGNWGNCDSLERGLVMTYKMNESRFEREWFVHSEVAKRMAQDMLYEYNYEHIEDPRLKKEMEDKGLVYEVCFNKFGDRYVMALPRQAVEENSPLPIVLILQEVYEGNEHLAVTALSYFAEWLEIAAQGECALMFYVLEDIESNDRAIDMIKDEAKKYNLDLTRVYVTGHSHDGYFSYAMANRNPDFVTAIALLGQPASPFGMNEKHDYELKHNIINYDMPTVNISGIGESKYPVNEDRPATEEERRQRMAVLWRHAFMNHNIPEKSMEEILDAFESEDYIKRAAGIAGDRCYVLWCDGVEHYFYDFFNKEGKNHLRVIRQQNMPHTVTPMMCTLSWDFVRRFKRDPETHEIIELF